MLGWGGNRGGRSPREDRRIGGREVLRFLACCALDCGHGFGLVVRLESLPAALALAALVVRQTLFYQQICLCFWNFPLPFGRRSGPSPPAPPPRKWEGSSELTSGRFFFLALWPRVQQPAWVPVPFGLAPLPEWLLASWSGSALALFAQAQKPRRLLLRSPALALSAFVLGRLLQQLQAQGRLPLSLPFLSRERGRGRVFRPPLSSLCGRGLWLLVRRGSAGLGRPIILGCLTSSFAACRL